MAKRKLTQAEKAALLKEAFIKKPELKKARRFLLILLAIWFCIRSADIIIGVIFNVLQHQGTLSFILSYISFIALVIFTYAIYNGYLLFVILPIIGGIEMMGLVIVNYPSILMALEANDQLYLAVSISSFLGGLLQVLFMLMILLNKNCRTYLQTVSRISNPGKERDPEPLRSKDA